MTPKGDGMPPQEQESPYMQKHPFVPYTGSMKVSAGTDCCSICGNSPDLHRKPSPAVEEGPAGGEAGQDHSDDDAKRHDAGHPMETAPPELSCGFCRDEIRKPMSGPAWTAGFEEGLREGYQRGLEDGRKSK